MNSNKLKREKLKLIRAGKKAELERLEFQEGLRNRKVIPVDKSKIISRRAIPSIPDHYWDVSFTCKDCGKEELWTAKQQKRWQEEQGGEIEAIAIRCRDCRRKLKARREAARKVHFDGLVRKEKAAGKSIQAASK